MIGLIMSRPSLQPFVAIISLTDITTTGTYHVRYRPEVTSHSLETFSLLLARVPLGLAIYQVESISF